MKASKLAIRLQAARTLNNTLATQIGNNIATGMTATFFMNASKDLAKVERQIRKAFNNGDISSEEFITIMSLSTGI